MFAKGMKEYLYNYVIVSLNYVKMSVEFVIRHSFSILCDKDVIIDMTGFQHE
ncbi:hypothetical protein [Clostridium pasteurianum]|uniref:hypothetical protein n=1 Tax=Clostridium pasteurianum TaxID=1501 RepID=UPI001A9A6C3E|nr:hypothetical protein [Clostridium pasteurianum]